MGAVSGMRIAAQQYPEPTVGALIFDREGKLFLMKSHKWKGRYCLPGGHVELGERLVEAVKREVKEETNLDICDIEFICFQEFVYDEQFWEPSHFLFFDYACRTEATDVRLNAEAEEYVWVTLEETQKLPVEHYTLVAIGEYLKKSRPVGEENRPGAGGNPRQAQGEDNG